MFSSEEKVKEILKHLSQYAFEQLQTQNYTIKEDELMFICKDFISLKSECENMGTMLESLRNYVRLLEKENKELRGENNE